MRMSGLFSQINEFKMEQFREHIQEGYKKIYWAILPTHNLPVSEIS